MRAADQAAWSVRRALLLGASMLLLAGAVLYRHALEASMASHMLLQMPAIFLSGVLAAAAIASAWPCRGAGPAGGGMAAPAAI